MNYVKHFSINGIDTKQVACIELNGRPNAATEGAVGVLGMDITSPTHDVYKCVAVNGSIYTWELLSSGMSIICANITGEGGETKTFPYSNLRIPDNYLIKVGDLILDSEGYLYQINSIGETSCTTTYCGTHLDGNGGSKDYNLKISNGKLQLVTGNGTVISNIDYLVPDDTTSVIDTATGALKVIGIYTIGGTVLKIFRGTQAEYNALTKEQKANLFPIITDGIQMKDLQNSVTRHERILGAVIDYHNGTRKVVTKSATGSSYSLTLTFESDIGEFEDFVIEEYSGTYTSAPTITYDSPSRVLVTGATQPSMNVAHKVTASFLLKPKAIEYSII